jgi:broad specificity phosphatase PhoE
MKLYLIRHGENQANIDRVFSYKKIDYPLTPRGVEQAHSLGRWFVKEDYKIAKIYSSPLRRASQTAEILAEYLDLLPVTVLEPLREVNLGVLDGKSDPEAWEIHDSIVQRWHEGESNITFEEGENHFSLRARLQQSLELIVAENSQLEEDQAIAVVAHGGLFTFGLPWICQNLTVEQTHRGLGNTGFAVIEATGTGFNCLQWAVRDHLS